MRKRIPAEIRRQVLERAQAICEYCQYPEEYAYARFHVEHIRSLKHLGTDDLSNLSYSCPPCNQAKGSDISTIISDSEVLVRLYHPRRDRWDDHFSWSGTEIIPLTDVGKATVQLLKLNDTTRLIERQRIIQLRDKLSKK